MHLNQWKISNHTAEALIYCNNICLFISFDHIFMTNYWKRFYRKNTKENYYINRKI